MSARPVLLIDKDSAWCEQVCRFLELHGIDAVAATSEAAAVQMLACVERPAAIFLEPTAVDAAFTSLLRDLPELGGVPLFLISAAPADAVFQKGVGVTGYVRKAVALEHVLFMLGTTATAPAERSPSLVAA